MSSSDNSKFASPSALRQFAVKTAVRLREAGISEAAELLDNAARYVTGSGSEWLGELGLAASTIRKQFKLSKPIDSSVKRIQQVARSRRPYGD